MKIHAIRLNKDMLINIFGNGERHYLIENGLSEDAILIGIGRIEGSIDYEILFEAESGVEIKDGDALLYINPIFTKIEK